MDHVFDFTGKSAAVRQIPVNISDATIKQIYPDIWVHMEKVTNIMQPFPIDTCAFQMLQSGKFHR